ncbi:stage III sporulation protein AF [Niameybacter massiliensis]|uniref:stage III sporulation protein AF n=1 Tax=Niameybacter massiliensis TaxID=1658108 RepID=UPI0006B52C21|nr:stage III sporulation protein AF [Niameybacter massiliensis]
MRNYLLTIIWTMLFVVIVEMIFPVSELKKYLKLVLGFIVLVVIASPLITLISSQEWIQGTPPSEYITFYQKQFEDGEYIPYQEEKKKQEESVKQVYQEQIEKQLTALLEAQLPVSVESLSSEVTLKGSHMSIQEVKIEVIPYTSESFITIGNKNESVVLNQEYLENEIKKCIKDFYNVDNANIYIIVQDS